MKIRAILMVTLVCFLTFSFSSTSLATQIYVDLQEVKADVAPQIINQRTMVPVRAIAEMVGCRVEWIADKKQVEIFDPASNVLIIVMQVGNKIANYSKYDALLNDRVGVECVLDSPPIIINNRTMVPLRFISEAIGYKVDYKVDNGDVYLFSPAYINNQIGEGMGETIPITNEEISYVLSFKTQSWLDLSDTQQDNVVLLIARWWDLVDCYVDPDLDRLKQDLNHQMSTYFRNQLNISLFETACDIRNINTDKYLNAKG
jgi:hypothetical protein